MDDLITTRLILRQPTEADAAELFLLRSNEEVNRFLDRQKAKSVDDAVQFIQKITQNIHNNTGLYWVIRFHDQPNILGTIALWNFSQENNSAEIGYELFPHYQGRGIMQEAIEKVLEYALKKFTRIEAWTHNRNTASAKLLEKNNFTRDINAEAQYIATGDLGDMMIYSLVNTAK